jgi:hypothetical protein
MSSRPLRVEAVVFSDDVDGKRAIGTILVWPHAMMAAGHDAQRPVPRPLRGQAGYGGGMSRALARLL